MFAAQGSMQNAHDRWFMRPIDCTQDSSRCRTKPTMDRSVRSRLRSGDDNCRFVKSRIARPNKMMGDLATSNHLPRSAMFTCIFVRVDLCCRNLTILHPTNLLTVVAFHVPACLQISIKNLNRTGAMLNMQKPFRSKAYSHPSLRHAIP